MKTNESSNKIGQASDVIASIAEQTNLLALNAAIEAARAGKATNSQDAVETMERVAIITKDQTKDDILDGLQNLSAIAEENSATTEEVTASMEEQAASIAEVAGASQTLVGLAQNLQSIMRKFTF